MNANCTMWTEAGVTTQYLVDELMLAGHAQEEEVQGGNDASCIT